MTSKTTILAVVIGILGVVLLCIAAAVALTIHGDAVPAFIENTAVAGTGGLLGILASTRGTLGPADIEPKVINGLQKVGGTQDVNVINPPSDPVQVETAATADEPVHLP